MATVTGNRPGAMAKAKMVRMSASKARVVLNLIRGKRVAEALEILEFSERLAADPIAKCLNSAIANAEHNEDLEEDDLFVSACFADEGPTLRRFRPRARGRAGRINKQTCHITVEVSRFSEDELDAMRSRAELKEQNRSSKAKKSSGGDRARRVAKSKAATDEPVDEDATDAEAVEAEETVEEAAVEAEDTVEEAAVEAEETAEAEAPADADAEVAEESAEAEADADADAESADDGSDTGSDEEEK
jgi:large subunit ribosomal protein L22